MVASSSNIQPAVPTARKESPYRSFDGPDGYDVTRADISPVTSNLPGPTVAAKGQPGGWR